MDLRAQEQRQDRHGRLFFYLDQENTDKAYDFNRGFWGERNVKHIDEEHAENIIAAQDGAYETKGDIIEFLLDTFAGEIDSGAFSLFELGAANGTLLDALADIRPGLDFHYFGFEFLPMLVEDFARKYPGKRIVEGDAELFVAKDPSFFGAEKFSLYFASITMMMLKPEIARQVLAKAAQLTDRFLLYDYLDVETLEYSADRNMVIYYPSAAEIWFIHPWERLMDEVGFKILEKRPMPSESVRDGMGMLYAVRR